MKHLFLVVWSLLLSLHWVHSRADDRTNCKPVTTSFCQGVGYTTTLHPNGVQGFNLQQIGQIVATACSPHVATLMCRVVVPECTSEDDSRMKPCRALCEKIKTDCESTLRAKGLFWPIRLRCETLPEANCVQFRSAGGLEPVRADTGNEAPIISVGQTNSSACQPINVPVCKDLHYTETVLPEDETQDNIALKINQFYPLVKVGCSSHLKPLLCSVFLPECVSGKPRSPCRTLCEKAKSGCEPLLNKFGLTWPEELKCTAFTTESCEHYGVSSSGGICEPITIPMCQGLSYNETLVPNLLGHTSQREAFTKMSFFNSIVQTVCSVDIHIFLCRVYAPQCEAGQAQWPCRSFCEKARRDCEGLMSSFGVSWPDELQCSSFPEEMCISENKRPEMLNAEDVVAKLEASGYSVYGKSLTLSTARLLLTLMDKLSLGVREEKFGVLIEYLGARRADKSKDLDAVEFFKLEHFVAIIRREYVESYGTRNPPSVTEDQLKKAVAAREFHLDAETFKVLWHEYRSQGGINYDKYVAVLTKLQILKDRFKAHLMNFPCDCQVASFTIKQFMKSAIV